MAHFEKELSRQDIFQGRVIDVKLHQVELENGKTATREVAHHNGGACVVAIDDQGRLLLVRQYRFAVGETLLELPAGKLEKVEDPLPAAARELEEETGYKADSLTLLTPMIPTPGYCSERICIYLAQGLTPTAQKLDEDEFLSVERVPFDRALAMVAAGELTDAKTQVGILLAARLLGK